MIVFPNAKINIGLNIVGRRPDGYHDIETVMYPIQWRDILEIVPSQTGETTLVVSGRAVDCPPEKNLVMKAYRKLSEKVLLPPVEMFLHKVIPDGAGLGGGSADAAFALVAMNSMFSLGLSEDDLARLASSIGSDCPFFIYNRPMLASGTGTVLSDVDGFSLNGKWIVVVKPGISVPTADAYRGVVPVPSGIDLLSAVREDVSRWVNNGIKNDFEANIFSDYPEIGKIKLKMTDCGALYASMSGSGSAVYGIFDNDKLAVAASNLFYGLDVFCSRMA